jgi:hypothetical protein
MANAVNFAYLKLDANYDPVFDPIQSLTGGEAVAQAVLTALKLFLGEWWENLAIGTPVFQVILGQLGSQRGQQAMRLAIQQRIYQAPYVTAVEKIETSFVSNTFRFSATVRTIFGTVTVNNLPGSSATLETQQQ